MIVGGGRHERVLPAPGQGSAAGGVSPGTDGQQSVLELGAGTRSADEGREKQNLHWLIIAILIKIDV